MKSALVVVSKTGNTAQLAAAIVPLLEKTELIYKGTFSDQAQLAELILIGFWTDKGSCSEDLQSWLTTLHHKQVIFFGTCGFGQSEQYFQSIVQRTSAFLPQDNTILGSVMCQGKMPESVRQRYVMMQQKEAENPKWQNMIDNFDSAITHPDQQDIEKVTTQISAFLQPLLK